MAVMAIEHPYLLFLGDAPDQLAAKTAQGIAHWRPEWCLGQHRLAGCNADQAFRAVTMWAFIGMAISPSPLQKPLNPSRASSSSAL